MRFLEKQKFIFFQESGPGTRFESNEKQSLSEKPENPDEIANQAFQVGEQAIAEIANLATTAEPEDQEFIAGRLQRMEQDRNELKKGFETSFQERMRGFGEFLDQTAEAVVEGVETTVNFAKERYASFPPEKRAQVDQAVGWVDEQLAEYDTSLREISDIFANMTDAERKDFVEAFLPGAEIDAAFNHGDEMSTAMVVGSVFFGRAKKAKNGVEALKRASKKADKLPDTTAVYRFEGMSTRDTWKILEEQGNMIKRTDLKEFMVRGDEVAGEMLSKRGNKWLEARLQNLKNGVDYITNLKRNPATPEGELRNSEYIREQLLNFLDGLEENINNSNFMPSPENRRLMLDLIDNLN